MWRLAFLVVLATPSTSQTKVIEDITSELGLGHSEGMLAAYGDFNSDRATDLFVIANGGKQVDIYMWHAQELTFSVLRLALKSDPSREITSLMPQDYDGDGCMDLLVVQRKPNESKRMAYVKVYWGDTEKLVEGQEMIMMDEPTLVDVNGDLLPDLFGTDESGRRTYWLSIPSEAGKNRGFHPEQQYDKEIGTTLSIPHSNAFIDMTGDFHPDLFVQSISTQEGDAKKPLTLFEIWSQSQGSSNLTLAKTILLNDTVLGDIKHMGQISFTDINSDHTIDLILPAITNNDVHVIFQYDTTLGQWSILTSNELQRWQFPEEDFQKGAKFPYTLRFGDFTMDGYTDAVGIFQDKGATTKDRFAMLLINQACNPSTSKCAGSRTLKHEYKIEKKNPVLVSQFDVYENGALDIVLVSEQTNNPGKYDITIYKNEFNPDATFLKVAVLSGRCYTDCACNNKKTPFGANQIGAIVEYSTTDTDGKYTSARAGQLSQSAYMALQLPYLVFGMGRSPNFVDSIVVGIPQGSGKVDRKRSWSNIIPNAQVIVIPYPRDRPQDWMTKLLVTPSKLLLQTGGVLLGTCLLVAGLILILHIKEKKEDEREKRKESHKFHFDAL